MKELLRKVANVVSEATGTPWVFIIAVARAQV